MPGDSIAARLHFIYEALNKIIALHKPDEAAIEEVFYSVNAKSALKLGQVRGVAMLAAAAHGLPVAEYAPLSVKSAVTGYGRGEGNLRLAHERGLVDGWTRDPEVDRT